MNGRILAHPLNWIIVLVVAVLGAMLWMHITAAGKMASAAVKSRKQGGGQGATVGAVDNTGSN